MLTRYLTVAEMIGGLKSLQHLYVDANDEYGDGLDLACVPYLRRLNRPPGVLTIQSCSGHKVPLLHEGLDGRLWVRLDKPMMSLFYEEAGRLTHVFGVNAVNIAFREWDGVPVEFVEILFSGLGRRDSIDDTLEGVTTFFEGL